MQLQDLSYKLNNDTISFGDYKLSIELFSFDNQFTVEDGSYKNNNGSYVSKKIIWGGTEKAKGKVDVKIQDLDDSNLIDVKASLYKKLRGVKLRLEDLPLGKLLTTIDHDKEIDEYGLLLKYPEGWRGLFTPLLVFELTDGKFLYIVSLDNKVREKRFFIKKVGNKMRVDFVFDEDATNRKNEIDVPTLKVGISSSKEEIFENHMKFLENAYGLKDFKNRTDVPEWFKNISLVVNMHMEHFTGNIFHTYESALEDIKFLTKYIPGNQILVYIPGWEGRYYYKYGDYSSDSRLGGDEKLKLMVDEMHKLGCKVMAMYGINIVNSNIKELKKIISKSEFVTAGNGRFHNGSVDWEGAHHYDYSDLKNLNIAAPLRQDYLFNQIELNTKKFDFDGAFLDIAACYVNDRRYNLYEGLVKFCDRLRTIKDDFLVSGEGYYDGLSKAMPLFQSGHTDGLLHYHDRFYEEMFSKYNREFAHLCLGDYSRGSSGTHELGCNTDVITPLRKGIIPTLCLVDGTIKESQEDVIKTIELSKEYYKRYII